MDYKKRHCEMDCIKKLRITSCHMAGGVHLGLTSQTSVDTLFGSDTISSRNPARPHTSDRCSPFKGTEL